MTLEVIHLVSAHTNFCYLALLKVILPGNSQGKPENTQSRAQLRRSQGSRIGDYSFVLSDVAGTPRAWMSLALIEGHISSINIALGHT